jgi:hypothetical protein
MVVSTVNAVLTIKKRKVESVILNIPCFDAKLYIYMYIYTYIYAYIKQCISSKCQINQCLVDEQMSDKVMFNRQIDVRPNWQNF